MCVQRQLCALKSSIASQLSTMCKLVVRDQNSIQTSLFPAPDRLHLPATSARSKGDAATRL